MGEERIQKREEEMENKRITVPLLAAILMAAVVLSFVICYVTSRQWPTILNAAVLYVGSDTGRPSMAFEDSVQKMVSDERKRKTLFSGHLPFYSYHFDRAQEKTACEEKFAIYRKDLPLLALVEVDDKNLPTRVLYRLKTVTGEEKEIADFLERSVRIMRGEEEGEKKPPGEGIER